VSLADQLQRMVDRQASKRAIRGVLAAIRSADGSVDVSAVAGWADAELSTPLTRTTPYFLASITKMYAATVVVQLAREGTIDLQAPIGTYLPPHLTDGLHVVDGTDHGASITVEQLLFQTSGLADYFSGRRKGERSFEEELRAGHDRALTVEDVVAIVRRLPPSFAPGADGGRKAHYSDTNYALLGAIVEAVTEESIATGYERRIFAPLGLEHTFLFDHARPQPTPAVIWYGNRPLHLPSAMSSFPADGGMVATLADILRFLQGFFRDELLSEDELAYLTRRWNRIFFPMRYGGGVMRFHLSRWMSPLRTTGELVGHSGSSGSFAFYNPRQDVFLAGTVNQSDSPSRPFRLMTRMLHLVS
jgi:D-alanyl-D-alanine carboxypeptidase